MKKPAKKKGTFTLRQRKFIKFFVESGNAAEAARRAGYSARSAKQIASENLSKPDLQLEITDLLGKHGLTDDKLALRITEGVDALETKFFQKDGLVTDEREVIAWSIRHQFVEMVLRLKGLPMKLRLRDLSDEQLIRVASISSGIPENKVIEEWSKGAAAGAGSKYSDLKPSDFLAGNSIDLSGIDFDE